MTRYPGYSQTGCDAEFDEIEDILASSPVAPGPESTSQFGACGLSPRTRYHVTRNERPLSFRLPHGL
jgi:hypothetical protein